MKKIGTGIVLAGLIVSLITACGGRIDKTGSNAAAEKTQEAIQQQEVKDVEITDQLSSYKIKYYEPKPISKISAPVPESDDPFIIADYGPQEELPSEVRQPSIYVVFSQPVVPLSKLGEPETASEIMQIDPPLRGVYRWYGTRLLSFDAGEDTLPQRQYTVHISENVRSLGGKTLTGKASFSFHTEYLSLRDFFVGVTKRADDPGDVPVNEAGNIHLVFSYPVNLDVIKDYISVETDRKGYSFTVSRPDNKEGTLPEDYISRTVVLHVQEPFPENTKVDVVIRKGARSEREFIGTPENITRHFETLKPFRYLSYDSYSWSFPRSEKGTENPVYLEFNHPVDAGELIGRIHTLPNMKITEENIDVWNNTVRINNLPASPESTYTIYLDAGVKDVYGQDLGKTVRIRVKVPAARRYAYFPNTGTRMLESQFPKKIVWEYQNVFDGIWQAGPITDPYSSFSPRELVPYDFSNAVKNKPNFRMFDFSKWLNAAGKGWIGFSWNFAELNKNGVRPSWAQNNLQLQVTDLAVTVRHGYNEVIAWVTSLSTGKPVKDARVSMMRDQLVEETLQTDDRGLAIFRLQEGDYARWFGDKDKYWKNHLRLRVEKGLDRIEFEPNYSHDVWRNSIWNTKYPTEIQKPVMETYMFTDRGLYKPGEAVTFRGIDRNLAYGRFSPYSGSYEISVREPGYDGSVLTSLDGDTTGSGGFFGSFTLPEDAKPGWYSIVYRRDGKSRQISFQVANFRRLGFSVDIEKPDITYYSGDTLSFTVSSEYLSGGNLTQGSYELYWSKAPASFSPPGREWKDYSFGPSEYDYRRDLTTKEGKIPATGRITTRQETTPEGIAGKPYSYKVEARISDVSNQIVAKSKEAVVHPASFYIGAKIAGSEGSWYTFVEKGKAFSCDLALVAPDGTPWIPSDSASSRTEVKVELYKIEWKLSQQQGVYQEVNTRWERVETLTEEKTVQIGSGGNPAGSVSFTPDESGSYSIRLSALDGKLRKAVTDLSFYCTGSDWVRWGAGDADMIELKPDKALYNPGDTAKILVQSPIPEGDYLITLEREGIFTERIEHIKGSAQLIEVPITSDYVPVIYVSVCSYTVRSGEPDNSYFKPDLDKPKGLFGIVPLSVDTDTKLLDVTVEQDKGVYEPGTEADVTVTVKKDGKPVENAEVTFLAADRGVLDLINYHVPDPLGFFYAKSNFPLAVEGGDSRSLLIDPVTYDVKNLQGGDDEDYKGDAEEPATADVKERKDFRATAVFEPFLTTDENGKVTVRFTLPDTLTTYRCTAVAVKENTYGFREDELKVQNPINVRTAFPRRLRYRDTAIGSVLVTNLSEDLQKVFLTAESDIIEIGEKRSKEVTVGAGETVEVPFQLLAMKPGDASVTITTESDAVNERLTKHLTVERPYIYETFTTIGKTDNFSQDTEGAEKMEGSQAGVSSEGLVLPSGLEDGEGSLDITLSGSRAAELGEALRYVLTYPYGCMEQRASKLLPLVLLEDYLGDFQIGTEVQDIHKTVQDELRLWAGYQRSDGGFPFWPSRESSYSSYYASLRAAHFLVLAENHDYEIPGSLDIKKLLTYLKNPSAYYRQNDYLMLYSLYVRALFGEQVGGEASRYLSKGDEIGLSGYGFLGLIFSKLGNKTAEEDCLKRIKQFIKPGTRTIDITETDEQSTFYNSQVEQLSLLLMLYLEADSRSDMVTRVANTLMSRQKAGIWKNTSDTNWAIQAFAALIAAEGGGKPDFHAEVTVDDKDLMNTLISSPSQTVEKTYPLTSGALGALEREKMYPLQFKKDGNGVLYYTASLRYAIPSEITYPRDEGIGVSFEITGLDGRTLQGRNLEIGKTYRMKAYISSAKTRTYLALRLPVPSGAEILDASFVTTPTYGEHNAEKEAYGDSFVPYSMDIMDNEVRCFWDEFPKGRQEVSFLFRTTNAGVYPTPAATAECMYEPEVFGRTGGSIFIIKRKNP